MDLYLTVPVALAHTAFSDNSQERKAIVKSNNSFPKVSISKLKTSTRDRRHREAGHQQQQQEQEQELEDEEVREEDFPSLAEWLDDREVLYRERARSAATLYIRHTGDAMSALYGNHVTAK